MIMIIYYKGFDDEVVVFVFGKRRTVWIDSIMLVRFVGQEESINPHPFF